MNQLILKYARLLWIAAIVICIGIYLYNPSSFSKEAIADYISGYEHYGLLVYLTIHILRGFVLLPSTPLIFAGVLLFPSEPLQVLTISLIGIGSSSLLIYFFSDKLGFSAIFSKKSKKIALIEEKLNGKYGFAYIIGWAFFPLVPTDLICYVAGALKIKVSVFIFSILLGELILCALYIYGGSYLIN
ncbi:hypothetical protein GWK08_13075 [Leptobacterium flavescens]|uniref:TVP38/TMEM64 family membrane protein n=1 Tax=Leptobacterium flavescens TaxID=472055 RepID=A0A6P0URH3_9FLAO|nr:VTT domain-containing protein [Leptobacterium flavescens]NER14379.1 hypothetical protein [Leptobacterium flavescens]